jgi:5-methylcytosine-specific restriction protein B
VDWDTRYEKAIPAQNAWRTVTVKRVPPALLELITSGAPAVGPKPKLSVPVDPLYLQIAAALERKGQLILYGPPGTGKTYTARRFAVWWLLRQAGEPEADGVLGDSERMASCEKQLSTAQVARRVWWVVANPKQWSWDQLSREGRVTYKYGRLKKNYALVQRGDWVIGYQATPDKKIVSLARISGELQPREGGEPRIELEWAAPVKNGLTYDELLADPILAKSEPLRSRCQGTLFALSASEADHLFSLLTERNPELPIGDEGGEGEIGRLTRVTFHPSYTYEDFIEGFRPSEQEAGGLALQLDDGIFKRVCRAAQAAGAPRSPVPDLGRRDQPRKRGEDPGRAPDTSGARQARPHGVAPPEQRDLQHPTQRVSAGHDEHGGPQHQAARRRSEAALRLHRAHARS